MHCRYIRVECERVGVCGCVCVCEGATGILKVLLKLRGCLKSILTSL